MKCRSGCWNGKNSLFLKALWTTSLSRRSQATIPDIPQSKRVSDTLTIGRIVPSSWISEHLNLGSAQYANRHWEIQSCSARTGDGLVKGIDWMVDDVASRIMLR